MQPTIKSGMNRLELETVKTNWFRQRLAEWAASNLRDFPWRRTADPYSIFVAEFLLQKTVAATASPIYEAFLIRYPTLDALVVASVADIASLLQPLGLSFRAERLCNSARIIADKYGGSIPTSEAELLLLPGIGLTHTFLNISRYSLLLEIAP